MVTTDRRRPPSAAQLRFFDAAMDLLAAEGYGGFKLAPLCRRLGVTTGAFYHSFDGWAEFCRAFLAHWVAERTVAVVDLVTSEPDPARRVELLLTAGVSLPHASESAIRVWAGVDPEVRALQDDVDRLRLGTVHEAFVELVGEEAATPLARAAFYAVIGYEQAADDVRDPAALEWILRRVQEQVIAIATATN